MTSQGTAHGRFARAVKNRNLFNAEIAAREMGELSLPDALAFCLLLADVDPPRFDRATGWEGCDTYSNVVQFTVSPVCRKVLVRRGYWTKRANSSRVWHKPIYKKVCS